VINTLIYIKILFLLHSFLEKIITFAADLNNYIN